MRGEIELRLKSIISEINTSEQPIILFIDEAHTIVASNGSQGDQGDIANLIKPELARGTLRTIAATTWSEYKRYIEKDAALSRRFQTVKVEEPNINTSIDILQALIPSLERHHGVSIMQTAIESAVKLSSRYIQGRQLPDKAISVLDTACARAVSSVSIPVQERIQLLEIQRLAESRIIGWQREVERTGVGVEGLAAAQHELTEVRVKLGVNGAATPDIEYSNQPDRSSDIWVEADHVASVVADWTGVPSQKMRIDQSLLVAQLESVIAQRVVGQSTATNLICNRLRAYTAKLEDPARPIGVFLLTGPSGVGKTETAHAIAEAFFGKSGITVVNMSEYQESHTVSKLKGAPAGYVGYGQGGVLTESIRRQPYGLLLLDEVEKAHPDVLDMFLQVFDKGYMEDSEGATIDFKNTLVLMTSNIGTNILTQSGEEVEETRDGVSILTKKLEQELLLHFKPAFIGRAQIVPYFMLTPSNLLRIVEMKLKVISDRFMGTYFADIVFCPTVCKGLVDKCTAQTIGARWLDQYISEHLLSRISLVVLERLAAGERVRSIEVSMGDDGSISVEMLPAAVSIENKLEEMEAYTTI
jgi:type VI secretion system protein VasG